MKKIFFSVCCASAFLFASCTEDRGTTTEVADANHDENVDPNDIRGYGNDAAQSSADMGEGDNTTYRQEAQRTASMMASDMKLDEATQQKVTGILARRNQQMAVLEDRYNYSETAKMGGEARNDSENDTSMNTNTNMNAARPNNEGNTYVGKTGQNERGYNNMNMTESQMDTERSKISQQTDQELKAVLSPEQYSMYTKNRNKYGGQESMNKSTGNEGQMKSQNQQMKGGQQ